MIKIGTEVEFTPFYLTEKARVPIDRPTQRRGRVIATNPRNDVFTVEFSVGTMGVKLRESFKYSQIGTDVKLCR